MNPTNNPGRFNQPTQPQEIDPENIRRRIRFVTSIPTAPPRDFYEAMVIYKSGSTYRLYVYVAEDNVWKYSSLS